MSINILRHIKVDLYGDIQRFAVAAKQLDMGTRYIGVTLMEEGIEYKIPNNVEIVAAVTRADGAPVWNDAVRSGNEALIELTRDMLLVQGAAKCDVELYQNGNLLSSASFEIMVFPSQRNDVKITGSGEYTRLENAIYAAREALQMAQEAANGLIEIETAIEAAERARVAAETAREIKESLREDKTAAAVERCNAATEAAILQTEECLKATEAALKVVLDQTALNSILNAVRDYYERIKALETDINITIDGGTPTSTDFLLIDGGTPASTDYDKYNAGNPYTI